MQSFPFSFLGRSYLYYIFSRLCPASSKVDDSLFVDIQLFVRTKWRPTINTYFDNVLYTELCNQSFLHTPHLIPSRGAMQGCRDGITS